MKILALLLPQFHEIKENNEWWGKGFTEWSNTKKTKALFKGHHQPRTPLNANYYNLIDPATQVWQSELALKNGLDGFVYYHYWFNGKLLLEKPMELMLDNKDVKIPFCISWANEPWTRSWDGQEKEILMPQVYGGKKEWKKHLEYLLPFFKDERYILKDNCPLFYIYRTSSIPNCDEMIEFWNNELKKNGFAGLYVVETLSFFQQKPILKNSKSVFFFEPMNILSRRSKFHVRINRIKNYFKKSIVMERYDYLWKRILSLDCQSIAKGKDVVLGSFVDWDNTPRKGKKGFLVRGASPKKFGTYLYSLKKKAISTGAEFIVVNAWNEWAEGTYLEPDEKNEHKYLEEIAIISGKN